MPTKKNIKIIPEKNENSETSHEKKAGPFNLKIFIFLQITLIVVIFVALKFFVRVEMDGINGISFSQINKDGSIDSSKKIGDVLQQAGINNLNEGNFDEASNKFEEVLQKDGENMEVLYQLALVKYNQKKYPEAIADLEKVIQKNPKKVEVYNILGNINRDLKKGDEAMKNYRQSIIYWRGNLLSLV